jgi:hypothetical protein
MFLARGKLKPIHLISVASAICLTLLCSCATQNSNRPQLPADVTMNQDAGHGDFLMITLQLENGEKLPLVVDTGTSITVFDKSLVPQLGKKIGDTSMGDSEHWGQYIKSDLYLAPNLYLGNVLLKTSDRNTTTMDLSKLASETGYPIKGVLGMNTLEHYCIQLDFDAGKIHFLDDETADKKNWGKAFPIIANNADARPFVAQNLLGTPGPHSLIDSGYTSDGWLRPKSFQQWTNAASPLTKGEVHSPDGMFGGEKYHDVSLDVQFVDDADGIGLNFLARHLVTLDFPKHTLYLKRPNDYRLAGKDNESATRLAVESTMKCLKQLCNQNRLPGVSKSDEGKLTDWHFNHHDSPYLDSVTFAGQKKDDSFFYHYTFTRTAEHDSWKLQKAWRADAQGQVVEEYPVP